MKDKAESVAENDLARLSGIVAQTQKTKWEVHKHQTFGCWCPDDLRRFASGGNASNQKYRHQSDNIFVVKPPPPS